MDKETLVSPVLAWDDGDILCGREFIGQIDKDTIKKKKWVYEYNTREYPLDLNVFIYNCPFIKGNIHYWFYPSLVFTDEYNPINEVTRFGYQETYRIDAIKMVTKYDKYASYNAYYGNGLMMGHGYTSGTLPYDGSNHRDVACVHSNKENIFVGLTWCWYNK